MSGFVLALVALALAMPCIAGEADMFRGNALKAGAHPDGRTLTVAELDACLEIEGEIRALKNTIDQGDITASLAETRYQGLAQVIDAKRSVLDTSDQNEIDDFNALVREQGEAVDTYNTLVVSLNDSVDAHASAVQRFNTQCAEIAYYESDLVKAYSIRERRLAASIEKERKSGHK